ncbi:kila n domain protein [Caudoviricetes sp.]|nr:kila n domain protein [Caudoviricetes sp.]
MTKQSKRQDIISHSYNGFSFHQRASDGYCDATAMCKANGKLFADYHRLKDTQEFIQELVLTTGIPIVKLVDKKEGRYGGTFVHPLIANDIARWCSAKFAVQVSLLIESWKQGRLEYKPKATKPELTPEYVQIRQEGKVVRKDLTHYLIKECGKKSVHVMNITDQIYRGLFGMDSKALRIARGFPDDAIVREHLTTQELFFVRMMEEKAVDLLEAEKSKGETVSSGLVGRVLKQLASTLMTGISFLKNATPAMLQIA